MAIQKFEDIIAWQKAQDFAVEMYDIKRPFCRAAVSISNNIAEEFDRSSDADVARFLFISIASCSEVKSMHHLAEK